MLSQRPRHRRNRRRKDEQEVEVVDGVEGVVALREAAVWKGRVPPLRVGEADVAWG
jgi:hypothetical protein